MPDATTASDWLPTFEFGLANDSSCLQRPVRASGAEGPFTLKLDARQSSRRWQPPALNVDGPTAAFEASELSLSTQTVLRTTQDRSFRPHDYPGLATAWKLDERIDRASDGCQAVVH